MPDVTQTTKEEKRGFWKGVGMRMKMWRDIIRTMTVGGRRGD